MYWLLNLLGLIKVVGQRQRSNLGLVLARVVGFVAVVALVVSIPMYSDAVAYRILRSDLKPDGQERQYPPFAYMFFRSGANKRPFTLDSYRKADAYLSGPAAGDLGLPPRLMVRYVSSDKLRLLSPRKQSQPASKAQPDEGQLAWVGVSFASGMEKKIEITDGSMPRPSPGGDGPVDVMIHEGMANNLGLQVGEKYLVREKGNGIRLPVRVAGVWRARNPGDQYWFIRPESLQDDLMLPEQSFNARVLTQGKRAPYQALWYMVLNGDQVRSRHVPELLGRITGTVRRADSMLPDIDLSLSPEEDLQRQYTQVRLLSLSLVIFSIPLLALVAYFIIMVTGMVVQRQQNEIAVLRSRGVSYSEVLGIYLLEGLGLGVASIVIGLLVGRYSALVIGWTRSFLDFIPRYDVPVEVSPESVRGGLWVIGLTLLASLLPALSAAGHTIISYKQERARWIRRPLWQRLYLDLLLLIPAYYGYRQLKDRGTVSFLGNGQPGGDPFSNPLLILTPALCLFALSLLSVRIFPIVMGFLGGITSRLSGVSSLLALRYLTRTPRAYTSPVLLLILTLSLATFTASMAKTLDSQLGDQTYYDVGADMRVSDLGENTQDSQSPLGGPSSSTGTGGETDTGTGAAPDQQTQPQQQQDEGPKWVFLPVTDYLRIPGVTAATRVSRSETQVDIADNSADATVLGVDRLDLPGVAHWRKDYAPASLGAVMNALGARDNGLLASRSYLRERGLGVGSKVKLTLRDVGEAQEVPFVIVGVLDYFPTLYSEDGPFFVANLDYLFDQQGGMFPYEVWLNVKPGTTQKQVEAGTTNLGLKSIVSDEAPQTIVSAEERPERQGVYGLLSVGFLASALLTGLGFLFYSIVSFQRRFIELGTLRAIGLSVRQMSVLLMWEQALIIGMGIVAGTSIGVWVSKLFIPFLQVRTGDHPQTPPFVVLIAWEQIQVIYLIFAVLLGLALAAVAVLLLRMKIFQAVKLGEAT